MDNLNWGQHSNNFTGKATKILGSYARTCPWPHERSGIADQWKVGFKETKLAAYKALVRPK